MSRRSLFWREQSGAVSVVAALSLLLLLAVAAMVIDIGSWYFARRNLQAVSDAAALAAVQDPDNATQIADAVFAQNGYSDETLSVVIGTYQPDEALDAGDRFTPFGAVHNAVQVRATIQRPNYFGTIFRAARMTALTTQSLATRIPTASFGAGTRLAQLDSGILNAVLGRLWGSSLTLTLVDYQSLLSTNVDALTFLDQLASDIDVTGDYAQLATAHVTVGHLITALAEAATQGNASGDPASALLALKTLQSEVGASLSLPLSDLLDLTPLAGRTIGGIINAQGLQLNMMSLLAASARDAAANGTTDLGSAISIPVTHSAIAVHIAAGNRMAQVADAQIGTLLHTGEIRIALVVTVTQVDLGVATVTLRIPLYMEVAPGQAQLMAMPCIRDGTIAEIAATSGTTTLGLGTVNDTALGDFSTPVTPLAAPVVSTTLLGIPVQVSASGSSGVNGSGPETLPFSQDDIDNGTIKSPSNANNTPFNDLGASTGFSVTILGNPGLQADLLNGLLGSLQSALNPVVSNIVSQLNTPVNSLLTALGVQLGTIDVRTFSASCRTPTLVE